MEERQHRVGDVDQRLERVGDEEGQELGHRPDTSAWGWRCAWACSRKSLRSPTSSMPPWLNGLQRRTRQAARIGAADRAELADRLGRVGRAGRLVAAAAGEGGGDPALVEGDQARAGGRRGSVSRQTLALSLGLAGRLVGSEQLREAVADAAGALALEQALDARAGDDHVVEARFGAARARAPRRTRGSARLTLLRCTALPIRLPDGDPEAELVAGLRTRRGRRRGGPGSGCRASSPRGRRGRSPRFGTDGSGDGARRSFPQRPTSRPTIRG